jgi:hypothetical protein
MRINPLRTVIKSVLLAVTLCLFVTETNTHSGNCKFTNFRKGIPETFKVFLLRARNSDNTCGVRTSLLVRIRDNPLLIENPRRLLYSCYSTGKRKNYSTEMTVENFLRLHFTSSSSSSGSGGGGGAGICQSV